MNIFYHWVNCLKWTWNQLKTITINACLISRYLLFWSLICNYPVPKQSQTTWMTKGGSDQRWQWPLNRGGLSKWILFTTGYNWLLYEWGVGRFDCGLFMAIYSLLKGKHVGFVTSSQVFFMSQWFLIPTPETLNVNRFRGQKFHMTPLLTHLSHSLYWNNWESNYKCKPFFKLTVKPDALVLVIKCYFFWDAHLLYYLYILTKNTTCTKKTARASWQTRQSKGLLGWGGTFFGGSGSAELFLSLC